MTAAHRLTLPLLIALAACTEPAPPMQGRCVDIIPPAYNGRFTEGPTLRCLWQSRTWDCTASGVIGGVRWACVATGPATAEEPKP